MASGLEDMGKENDSMAGRKETASEKKADKNPFQTAAALFGNCGVISVLFETPSGFTPSGFAIFGYNAAKLTEPEAVKHIWADFAKVTKPQAFWMRAFQAFEVKDRAINNTYVSPGLSKMIRKYVLNGQKLAVGNEDYKNVIYETLGIPCVYSPVIKELMWGLRIQIRCFLPPKNSEITNEDRFPMSEGMVSFLNYHKFDINPHVTVTKRIIEMAGVVYKCDRCVNKHGTYLRLAAQHLMEISQIDSRCWDLMKLATALKMICDPEDKISDARRLFSKWQLKKLTKDAPQYTDKISKGPCLEVYKEMYSARKTRLQAARVLVRLVEQAKTAYEAEQAGKAASDCEIGPDRKKICRGFDSVIIDELTECHTTLSAKRKEREVPPTLAPVDALERYTQISSHPLNMANKPGILTMDIHPLRDIVATGGIDTNITSLKFVNQNGLFITGSADKTVRIWQGIEDENYSCIHTLKDHTAEVEAVAVHASQKYVVTISRDNSWHFYDISIGSCLAQVVEPSGQEGCTSAAFHPDGLILGTGTTDGAVKIWDVKTQSRVATIGVHVGPVNAMSFSENGYLLATAGLDGVKIWDIRTYGDAMNFRLRNFYSHTPTNVAMVKETSRASWSYSYERGLAEILVEHNVPVYRGQNGWVAEGWKSIVSKFNLKFPSAQFTKQQIQEKEKDMKAIYKAVRDPLKQMDDALSMILAQPIIWEKLKKDYPRVKRYEGKPFLLFRILASLYEGSIATGDLNFLSIPGVDLTSDVVSPNDSSTNQHGMLNPFSTTHDAGQSSNMHGQEAEPTTSASSGQKVDEPVKKRKQS